MQICPPPVWFSQHNLRIQLGSALPPPARGHFPLACLLARVLDGFVKMPRPCARQSVRQPDTVGSASQFASRALALLAAVRKLSSTDCGDDARGAKLRNERLGGRPRRELKVDLTAPARPPLGRGRHNISQARWLANCNYTSCHLQSAQPRSPRPESKIGRNVSAGRFLCGASNHRLAGT